MVEKNIQPVSYECLRIRMSSDNSFSLKKLGNSAESDVGVHPEKCNESVSRTFINSEGNSGKSLNFKDLSAKVKNGCSRAVDTDIPLGGTDEYIG